MRRKLKKRESGYVSRIQSVTVRLFRRPTLPIGPHKTLGKERIIKYKWELEGKTTFDGCYDICLELSICITLWSSDIR